MHGLELTEDSTGTESELSFEEHNLKKRSYLRAWHAGAISLINPALKHSIQSSRKSPIL